MDLLLEGIMIAILMAVILIFIVSEYSAFFAPTSSISYYNSFVGMADSACSSIQTASNVQFTSPKLFVFQMYDSQSCNSILSSNSYIFSPTSAVLSSLDGNYDICYANISNPGLFGISSGSQYFLKRSTKNNINFYYPSAYSIQNSSNMSVAASNNQLGIPDISVNSSSSFSIILNASSPANPNNYTFNLHEYSNESINLNIYFNGQISCEASYSDLAGVHSFSISSPCSQHVNNLTIFVLLSSNQETNYQVNVTAVPNVNPTISYLSQQCNDLVPFVENGIIDNGSIVCQPVLCGGSSFYLSDQNNRPFLGLYGESYNFLAVQSGVDDLQIVNSYSENLINGPLMDETFFVETGLTSYDSWSVTYNGTTKSAKGNEPIGFLDPPGNYNFTVPNSVISTSPTLITIAPNISKGTVSQGSYITIKFG